MAPKNKAHLLRMQHADEDCDMQRESSASTLLYSGRIFNSAPSHAPTTSYSKSKDGEISKGSSIQQMFPCIRDAAGMLMNVYGRDGKMVAKIQFQTAMATSSFIDVKLIVIGSDHTLSLSQSLLARVAYLPRAPSDSTYYFAAKKLLLKHVPLLKYLDTNSERTGVQLEEESSVCDDKIMLEQVQNEVHHTHCIVQREKRNDVKLQRELGRQIAFMETEISNLKEKLLQQTKELKACHDQVLELKGNIRVFCRCRPLTPNEDRGGNSSVIEFSPLHNHELHVHTHDGIRKTFKFDRVFTPLHSQEDVFLETTPLVVSVLDGFNVCIFAYGQTGTGKTFTMEGSEGNRGVNYRTLATLFQLASQRKEECRYEISVSVLEVYNEEIHDLLASSPPLGNKLEIRQVAEGMHHVVGAEEARVHSIEEVWKVLQSGSRARAVGSTNANKHSSRSHCLLCVMVKGENLLTGEFTKSKLWLIDLAGSERIGKTDVCGERLKEAQNINKSLSALGDVIHALASKNSHIPYRNSKITHLLQGSLGGQSKTLMFVQISPSVQDVGETLCSLNFASRVRGIELGAARKQLDPVELIKYKKMVEKTREDGFKKDAIIVELQAAAKVKEQTCKALSVKVKENESFLSNEKKARVMVEEKLKEQQMLIDKQRLMIDKLSVELKAKQPGLLKTAVDHKIPSSAPTPRRPPLQERQTDNREQTALCQTKKRAAEGYTQKENVYNEVDYSTFPVPKRSAILQEEELPIFRHQGRGRTSLCVMPQREPSPWVIPVAQPPPTVKFAKPRTRMSMACPGDPALFEAGESRQATKSQKSFMAAPQRIHIQTPHLRQPRCSGGECLATRVGNMNCVTVARGKPPQHPHQARIAEELQHYQAKRLLISENTDEVHRPLNKMRRLSAATLLPQSSMGNWALPPVPTTPGPTASVLVGGDPQSHPRRTPSSGRLSMTSSLVWEKPWATAAAAMLPSTPVHQPMLRGAQRVPLSSKKGGASRTLIR